MFPKGTQGKRPYHQSQQWPITFSKGNLIKEVNENELLRQAVRNLSSEMDMHKQKQGNEKIVETFRADRISNTTRDKHEDF